MSDGQTQQSLRQDVLREDRLRVEYLRLLRSALFSMNLTTLSIMLFFGGLLGAIAESVSLENVLLLGVCVTLLSCWSYQRLDKARMLIVNDWFGRR
jgi:hypothetical protein